MLVSSPVAAAGIISVPRLEVPIVRRLHVGHVQKSVAADAKVYERRLDAGLDIDDAALIDVPHVAFMARALHIQLFQDAVLHNGDPAFLWLEHVDQHFLLHELPSS